MDAFDLLILLLFIGAPLIEGLLRKRRSEEREADEGTDGRESGRRREAASAGEPSGLPSSTSGEWERGNWEDPEDRHAEPARGGAGSEGSASDMVPDDLWEVLTGERRSPPPAPERDEPEPSWAEESVAVKDGMGEIADSDWLTTPWDEAPKGEDEPVSLEYIGPEAVSLEQPLQDPEERHRDFHDKMDSLIEATSIGSGRQQKDPSAPLRAALQDPSDVRQAILLSEILGPPVGLRNPDDQGGA